MRSRRFARLHYFLLALAAAATLVVTVIVSATRSTPGARINPISVSFANARDGWVLGLARCGKSTFCFRLEMTHDGGRSWRATGVPRPLRKSVPNLDYLIGSPSAPEVAFANSRDGWAFGTVTTRYSGGFAVDVAPIIWSTFDGGQSWNRQRLPSLGPRYDVLALAAWRGHAYLLAISSLSDVATVWSTEVGASRWIRSSAPRLLTPAGGGELQGGFTFAGSHAWVAEGNDRGETGAAQLDASGAWRSWVPPCWSVGDTLTIPAVASGDRLLATCMIGGYGAVISPSDPPGSTVGSSRLYWSLDGGRSFRAGPELPTSTPFTYYDLVPGTPAIPRPGVIVLSSLDPKGNHDTLIVSNDEGQHWRTSFGGNVISVAFPAKQLGVGIAWTSATASELIISRNSGRSWAPRVLRS